MPRDSHIYGTCNGLICLSDGKLEQDSIIYLWNPAIWKVKTFPKSPISFVPIKNPSTQVSLAFGFLPKINDYKVIKIVRYKKLLEHVNPGRRSSIVEIYSLRTNSWKKLVDVDDHFPAHYVFPRDFDNTQATFVNGAAYWIPLKEGSRMPRILLCFDMDTETMRQISLPKLEGYSQYMVRHGLSVYAFGESLALCSRGFALRSFDMWILERNSVNEDVWKKHTSVSLPNKIGQPIGLRNNGDVLLEKYGSYSVKMGSVKMGIVAYDRETQVANSFLKIRGRDQAPTFINPFVDSLVLVDDISCKPYSDESWRTSCGVILEELMNHEFGRAFNTPVDAVALKIPNYHQIILHPMDLGTVKTSLRYDEYGSPRDFAADVRLTFDNALTYNPKRCVVNKMAGVLLHLFEQKFNNAFPASGI